MRLHPLPRLTTALSLLFIFGLAGSVGAQEALLEELSQLPKPDLSSAALQEQIAKHPDNGLPEYLLATHLFEQGRPQEALAHLQRGNEKPHCSTAPFLSTPSPRTIPEEARSTTVDVPLLARLRELARQCSTLAEKSIAEGEHDRARGILDGVFTMGERTMAMHPQEIIKVLTGVAIKHIALAEMERLAEATENEALWSEIIKERARLDDLKAGAEQFRKGVMPQFMRRISDFLAPLALVAPLYVELPLVLVLGLIWLVRRPPGKAVWSWPRALTLYAGIFLAGGGIVAVGFWMISRNAGWGGVVGGVLVLLYSILAPVLLHRTARRRVATRSLSATDGLKLHGGALLFLVLLLGLLCPFYRQHYRALPWQMPQADLGMSQEESLYVTRLLAGGEDEG